MGSRLRVFGPDHKWQYITMRPDADTKTIMKIIREETKAETDITIILEPFGEKHPMDFPYPDKE